MILLRIAVVFAKISYFTFGGYAMIPLITDEMTRLGWMKQSEIANLFAIAEMTPGSVIVNMSTYAGIREGGLIGSVFGALGVMMPSLTIGLLAAYSLSKLKDNRLVQDALYGLRPVTVAMIFVTAVTLVPSSYFDAAGALSLRSLAIGAVSFVAAAFFKADAIVQIALGAGLGLLFL